MTIKMKNIVLALIAAMTANLAYAQSAPQRVSQWMKDNGVFQNLDVSLTAGTTGIGIDVASRVHENVQLRMGYEYMPRFLKNQVFLAILIKNVIMSIRKTYLICIFFI